MSPGFFPRVTRGTKLLITEIRMTTSETVWGGKQFSIGHTVFKVWIRHLSREMQFWSSEVKKQPPCYFFYNA